jgi:hypothetical protein
MKGIFPKEPSKKFTSFTSEKMKTKQFAELPTPQR